MGREELVVIANGRRNNNERTWLHPAAATLSHSWSQKKTLSHSWPNPLARPYSTSPSVFAVGIAMPCLPLSIMVVLNFLPCLPLSIVVILNFLVSNHLFSDI